MYSYVRHQPENTLLYQLIEKYYPTFVAYLATEGRSLPDYVHQEFEDYLKCGRLEHGFLRVRCENCHHERLVAFSCKRRGFCPSCGARRMVDSVALLVGTILPRLPMRQWVQFSLSLVVIVCKAAAHDEQGACDCLSYDINISY